MEKPRDPMITFRSVIRGKNSKGGDRTQLYLNRENIPSLLEVLTANQNNEEGVKFDLHISKKEYEGRSFDSAIAFVKAVEGSSKSTKSKFVPKTGEATADKIAQLKAAQIK